MKGQLGPHRWKTDKRSLDDLNQASVAEDEAEGCEHHGYYLPAQPRIEPYTSDNRHNGGEEKGAGEGLVEVLVERSAAVSREFTFSQAR